MEKYTGKNWLGDTYTINIKPSVSVNPLALQKLESKYLLPSEKSPHMAFGRASIAFSDSEDMAQRIYNYVSKNWFMFATPVLANGGTERGLPISCFLSYVPDSRDGLVEHFSEIERLSSIGGGVGGYWGDVRPIGSPISRGGESSGIIPFMNVVDKLIMAFSQGATRRGSYAAYLPISHPEIEEFLSIRDLQGDKHRRVNRKSFHTAVIIDDDFMEAVFKEKEYGLIDPNTNKIVRYIDAVSLWRQLLTKRHETGEPFIMFQGNVDKNTHDVFNNLGLNIKQSNLCTEILLPTGIDHLGNQRTAVCCLSSVNLEKYDEWKEHKTFIYDMVRFLDNVLQAFIDNAPSKLKYAKYSAERERSLGLGAMGFHSYLQKMSIPFESSEATKLNIEMFQHINKLAHDASHKLGIEKGFALDCKEAGIERRNAVLTAIAPNASSSILCDATSPGIEPWSANIFMQNTDTGALFHRNKYLARLLKQKEAEYNINIDEVWSDINRHGGSVQHLDFLTEKEKAVFKTAREIDQTWILWHASTRQPYIDQGQSVNVFFPAEVEGKIVDEIHKLAYKYGLPTLYYTRSDSVRKAHGSSVKPKENKLQDYECDMCVN